MEIIEKNKNIDNGTMNESISNTITKNKSENHNERTNTNETKSNDVDSDGSDSDDSDLDVTESDWTNYDETIFKYNGCGTCRNTENDALKVNGKLILCDTCCQTRPLTNNN